MVFYWDLMGFYGILLGFYWDFMVFYWDLMGYMMVKPPINGNFRILK